MKINANQKNIFFYIRMNDEPSFDITVEQRDFKYSRSWGGTIQISESRIARYDVVLFTPRIHKDRISSSLNLEYTKIGYRPLYTYNTQR